MWRRHDMGHIPLFAATASATAAPLVYYWALGRFDPAWALAGRQNSVGVPALAVVMAVLPLGLPAILAYRLPVVTFQAVAVRAWPVVALGLFWAIAWTHIGTYPLHALQGLSIPFACLAVMGVSSIKLTMAPASKAALGSFLVILLLLPAGLRNLNDARSIGASRSYGQDPYFITVGEQRALNYLKHDSLAGAVLAPIYIGQTVPGETGRQTWVGIYSWTPNYARRVVLSDALFSGRLSPAQAVSVIKSSGARFLLSDCRENFDLNKSVRFLFVGTKRFGCSSVYRVASGQ